MIELVEVKSRSQLKQFIYLTRSIYRDHQNWVPPLFADEWSFHDETKNEALKSAKTIRFLIYQDGEVKGRVMGIIPEKYNEVHHERTARFYQLDCVNNPNIFHELISAIEKWAAKSGMNKIIGPYGFSDKDPQGYQVEGFEHLALIATPSHPSYLPELLLREGYSKELDCVSYLFNIPTEMPPIYHRIYDRIISRGELSVIEFKTKSKLKPYIIPVFHLVNEAYANLFGFVPMSETEIIKFAAQYLPILDPDFVKVIVNKRNEVVAFVVAMPNMSEGLQKARGKLFPFGFVSILRSMHKAKQLDLLLGAVKPGYKGIGLTAMLAVSLLTTARKRGLTQIDSHLILEENRVMRAECENLDGKIHKRFRVFGKELTMMEAR